MRIPTDGQAQSHLLRMLRHGVRRQLLEAEALRQDGRSPYQAYLKFKDVLEDRERASLLSPKQRRWAQAHCGAAASEAFSPNGDTDYLLLDAEHWLSKALEGGGHTAPPYPWARAMLGEVYRGKGNLPILWFHHDEPVQQKPVLSRGRFILKLRDCATAYEQGEQHFRSAIKNYTGGDDELSPGWLKAHLGALLINKRRYYKDDTEMKSVPGEALRLIEHAAELQEYRSPWTNQYLSAAHFTVTIQEIKLGWENYSHLLNLLLSLELSVMGWYTAPNLMQNPIQPGALEMDATFTLMYDLFDLMVTPTLPKGLSLEKLISATRGLIRAFSVIPKKDLYLTGASELRFHYAAMFATYRQRNALKAEAASNDVNHQLADMTGQVLEGAKKLLSTARTIRRTTPGLMDEKPLSMAEKNGFLLAVLSVLTSLMKAGAIITMLASDAADPRAKESDELTKELAKELDVYDRLLPVLNHCGAQTIKLMVELNAPNSGRWLLAPLWSGGVEQETALRKLLKIGEPGEAEGDGE